MGVQKKQPDEIDEPVQEQPLVQTPLEEPTPEPVPEPEPKKVGRPKKEKKPRTPAQLANDEKQRQRFKKEHEARKKKPADKKPEEPKAEPPPVPEQVPEEPAEESEPEVDEETVYIKRKPRRKTKRTYVIEPPSSDESSDSDADYEPPRRGYQRRVPQPSFSQESEPFTLTFK